MEYRCNNNWEETYTILKTVWIYNMDQRYKNLILDDPLFFEIKT